MDQTVVSADTEDVHHVDHAEVPCVDLGALLEGIHDRPTVHVGSSLVVYHDPVVEAHPEDPDDTVADHLQVEKEAWTVAGRGPYRAVEVQERGG